MRVIFCGTRYCVPQIQEKIIEALDGLDPEGDIIIHGNCSGVDKMAGVEAGKRGFAVEIYEADWKKHGKAAGPIRNKVMLDSGADKVYAFPFPNLEKSRGTKNMVAQAQRAGVRFVIFLWRSERVF